MHALQNALLEFLTGFDPNAFEEGSGHFPEYRFNQIEPGSMLRGMDIEEAVGPRGEISHGFLGDVRRMVVQNDPDGALLRVMLIKFFEQQDKLAATMARMNLSEDLAIVQVYARQDGQRPMALVPPRVRLLVASIGR